MSSLEHELAKLAAAPGPQPGPEALPVPELERDPEELARERFEQLRQRVDVEPRDESWRSGAERHVADQFRREDLGIPPVGSTAAHALWRTFSTTTKRPERTFRDLPTRSAELHAQMQLDAENGVLSTTRDDSRQVTLLE
jgi:hypothetical protein